VKFYKAEQDCFRAQGDAETSLAIEDLRSTIKLLVTFHKCFISCAAECPNSIYFIQSSGKHNELKLCTMYMILYMVAYNI
jgi:hypothetical protein